MDIQFTFEQVLELLNQQKELALLQAWRMRNEALGCDDPADPADPVILTRIDFNDKFRKEIKEPQDIITLKKYFNHANQ